MTIHTNRDCKIVKSGSRQPKDLIAGRAVVDTTHRGLLHGYCYNLYAPPIAHGSFCARTFRLRRRLGTVPRAVRRRDFTGRRFFIL